MTGKLVGAGVVVGATVGVAVAVALLPLNTPVNHSVKTVATLNTTSMIITTTALRFMSL
jgi:hypothetical protein